MFANGKLMYLIRFLSTLTLWQRNCVAAVLRFVRYDEIDRWRRWPHIKSPNYRNFRLVECMRDTDTEEEKDLLGMLDKHMKYESNRRYQNPMMLGLCIRRLSLYYRRKLIHIEPVGKNSTSIGRGIKEFQELQESVRSMYNGCISAYSKVYHKSISPYSANWRLEDHTDEFGNDSGLAERVARIVTEERTFCASKTFLEFTSLVAKCTRRGS